MMIAFLFILFSLCDGIVLNTSLSSTPAEQNTSTPSSRHNRTRPSAVAGRASVKVTSLTLGHAQNASNASQLAVALCAGMSDIPIVVDVSGSVTVAGIEKTQTFLRNFLQRFQLSRASGQLLGLIQVGKHAQVLTPGRGLTDVPEEFLNAVAQLSIDPDGWALELAKGLAYARTVMIDGRAEAHNNVLVIADGPAMYPSRVKHMTKQLMQYGTYVVILLVTSPHNVPAIRAAKEWLSAGPPHMGEVIVVDGYDRLSQLQPNDMLPLLACLCPQLAVVEEPKHSPHSPPTYDPSIY